MKSHQSGTSAAHVALDQSEVLAAVDHVMKDNCLELAFEKAERRLRDALHQRLMCQAKCYQVLDETERKVVLSCKFAKLRQARRFAVVAQNRAEGSGRVQSRAPHQVDGPLR